MKLKSRATTAPLEAQLAAYSAESRAVTGGAAGSGWKAGLRHWPTYGVATAAALAGATSASAGVIYTPLNVTISAGSALNLTASSSGVKHRTGQGKAVTFLNGPLPGQPEVLGLVSRKVHQASFHTLDQGLRSSGLAGAILGAAGGVMGTRSGSAWLASALNKGAMISGGKNFSGQGILRERGFLNTALTGALPKHQYSNPNAGNFVPGQTFFAGLKLAAAQGTVTHNSFTVSYGKPFTFKTHPVTAYDYGWLQLRVDELAGLPVNLTLLGYAYDDSGSGITAGDTGQSQTSAAPEPSTAAMLLLAAGATGIAAWKRRRKASA